MGVAAVSALPPATSVLLAREKSGASVRLDTSRPAATAQFVNSKSKLWTEPAFGTSSKLKLAEHNTSEVSAPMISHLAPMVKLRPSGQQSGTSTSTCARVDAPPCTPVAVAGRPVVHPSSASPDAASEPLPSPLPHAPNATTSRLVTTRRMDPVLSDERRTDALQNFRTNDGRSDRSIFGEPSSSPMAPPAFRTRHVPRCRRRFPTRST